MSKLLILTLIMGVFFVFYPADFAQMQENDPAEEAQALWDEGNALMNSGDMEGALDKYEALYKLSSVKGLRDWQAMSLLAMGFIYQNLSRYDIALDMYETALLLFQKLYLRGWEGATLNNIGTLYDNQGQYEEALSYYEQALVIAREVGNPTGESRTLNSIGVVYDNQGQYREALSYYEQALVIAREADDRVGEGIILNNIGSVYDNQGQYREALSYYEQALMIDQEVGDRAGESTVLNNIGAVYKEQGQYGEALSYYEQALAIAREVGDRAGEGITLNNIGLVYEEQGQYGEALSYYEQALVIHQETGDRAGESTVLNNIGTLYHAQGQYGKALGYHEQALVIHQETGDRAGKGTALNNIGLAYEAQGQLEDAILYLKQAIDITETIHADIGLESGQVAFFSVRASTYDVLVALLAPDAPVEALFYTERGRSRTFLFQLSNERLPFGTGGDAELLEDWQSQRDELTALQKRRVELASELIPPMDSIAEIDALITDAEQELTLLEDRIAIQNPALAQFTRVNVPDLASIQAVIPDDTTLLSYYLTDNDVFAFILMHSTFDMIPLDVTAEQIRDDVTLFRSDETQIAILSRLYESLILPIKDKLTTTKLVIAPHDVLNYIPFGALQDEAGVFLADNFTISYTPSITVYTVLKENRPEALPTGTPLILGNPETDLPDLPGAEAEAVKVADELGVDVIIGTDATETFFRQHIAEANIIHVAAHGSFNTHNTLSSFLALTEDADNDGHLEVREVYSLPIQEKSPLVVLSACQTAVGELTAGDDFQGLTRAFLLSGARAVIASLWSVNDEATSVLMIEFYRNRNTGMSDAEALTAAQQTVRDDPEHPEWANPYYWSAFVLVE